MSLSTINFVVELYITFDGICCRKNNFKKKVVYICCTEHVSKHVDLNVYIDSINTLYSDYIVSLMIHKGKEIKKFWILIPKKCKYKSTFLQQAQISCEQSWPQLSPSMESENPWLLETAMVITFSSGSASSGSIRFSLSSLKSRSVCVMKLCRMEKQVKQENTRLIANKAMQRIATIQV